MSPKKSEKVAERTGWEAKDKEHAPSGATELSEESSARAAAEGAVDLEATDQGSDQSKATKRSQKSSAEADKAGRG